MHVEGFGIGGMQRISECATAADANELGCGLELPGNPEVPISVLLDAPLGSRQLFDGSTIPSEPRS